MIWAKYWSIWSPKIPYNKISRWFYTCLLCRRHWHVLWTCVCSPMPIVFYLQAISSFVRLQALVSREAIKKAAALLRQWCIYVCIVRGVATVQRFLVTPKLVGGWDEDGITMFIAEIPYSNSCHLHYCQINSELLPIIQCLAWGKWNGAFASVAERRE